MAGVAALIADTGHPAMRQFVFRAERVMVGVRCWLIFRKSGQRYGRAASNRQVIAAKGYDGIWICRVSIRVVHVRREGVAIVQKQAGAGVRRTVRTWEGRLVIDERWIEAPIKCVRLD